MVDANLGIVELTPDTPETQTAGPFGTPRVSSDLQDGAPAIESELRGWEQLTKGQFQAIVDHIHEAILVREPGGQLVYANENAAWLLGFASAADLLATPLIHINSRFEFYTESGERIPPDRLPSILALQGIELSGTVMRYRPSTTGEERWAEVKAIPIKDEQGDVQYGVSMFSDITERRQAQEALKASEARFHAFMDNSPIVAFLKDEEKRFVYASRPFARLWYRTAEEMVGTPDSALVPEDVIRAIHQDDDEMLASGRLKEIVELIPTPDGAARHFLTFKFPVTDQSGRRYIGGASVDITERIRAEEALQQYADRLQALSRQLIEAQESERKRIARELHDQIGQALTAIKIDLQIAQHQGTNDSRPGTPSGPEAPGAPGAPERAEALEAQNKLSELSRPTFNERLGQSIAMVERTIQQVRAFSLDLRPSILDDLGLPSALLWYVEEQCQRAELRAELAIEQIDTRLHPELQITCFRVAQEAITNVVRHAHATLVAVSLRRNNGDVVLTVRDDGAGFDPHALASEIVGSESENGHQLESGATSLKGISRIRGLGLAGMHERMLLVGGQLSIDAAPGAGTTVKAVFPLSAFPAIPSRGTAR